MRGWGVGLWVMDWVVAEERETRGMGCSVGWLIVGGK